MKLSYEVYNGQHQGISFAIHKSPPFPKMEGFPHENKDRWTFYLYLNIEQMPEAERKKFWLKPHDDGKRISYAYMGSDIDDINFHGGCTYYDKLGGVDGQPRRIKIGCDYMHLHDEERDYSIEYILSDVKEAIRSFWILMPEYKVYCQGHGGFYLASEGLFMKEGAFYSNEYILKQTKENQESIHARKA